MCFSLFMFVFIRWFVRSSVSLFCLFVCLCLCICPSFCISDFVNVFSFCISLSVCLSVCLTHIYSPATLLLTRRLISTRPRWTAFRVSGSCGWRDVRGLTPFSSESPPSSFSPTSSPSSCSLHALSTLQDRQVGEWGVRSQEGRTMKGCEGWGVYGWMGVIRLGEDLWGSVGRLALMGHSEWVMGNG